MSIIRDANGCAYRSEHVERDIKSDEVDGNTMELLQRGIKPNTTRLSVGIENIDDLLAALDTAFDAVK